MEEFKFVNENKLNVKTQFKHMKNCTDRIKIFDY